MNRRHFLIASVAGVAGFGLGLINPSAAENPKVFRIGFQKNGVVLVAKQQKLIEKLLDEDSDEVARLFRFELAHHSDLNPPTVPGYSRPGPAPC